ncbi:Transferring glycosyl group transferase [Quillaja saponaria]|uniref:Transferring glycosyl group transferase n=1 Tax=Quillaja saponaria TaxID=32244 RepID=A0AAD7P7J6_QUISA|nr:Transferring glycosyl group transferase [Quillaja saponaria]KAJ7945208.1 Transferring glycosyl group transferase [Quillaja saponaria]
MVYPTQPISLFPFFVLLLFLSSSQFRLTVTEPTPAAWPLQFHSVLFMNRSGSLQKVDLWYDWPNGRNFNIIQNQLGKLTYDLEWNNGTSYIYTLKPFEKECRTLHVSVGILRPNWLDGATYLGQQHIDGFLCNVWEKVDFIWYYEDVLTQRPVYWVFYTGYSAHVMTFEVGAVLEDAGWQAPVYCFDDAEKERRKSPLLESVGARNPYGRLMTGILHASN